jgi:sigma-E factor negative regulatory protein RseB
MKQAFWIKWAVPGLVLALLLSGVRAEPDPLVEQRDALTWLKKIQTAARHVNYAGTFVYQEANQVRTSRITHFWDGKNEMQKLEILDGKPREFIRVNDDVSCYVPDAKLVLVEKKAGTELFHSMLPANFLDQAGNYHLKGGEPGRVAGFDCHAVVLEPKDNLRYGYKLCAEQNSGLLLRAQTVNERNEVLEQIIFTDLAIGAVDKSKVKTSYPNTHGWRVENTMVSQMPSSGWRVNWVPPGFKKSREMRRQVGDPANGRELVQMVFSDGVASISVFIELASPLRTEGSAQQGAINVTSKRQGEYLFTVVGEVPAAAIKQVANSIEHKSK